MSDRPDEENPLEHLLNDRLLEQLHVRIHSWHVDVNLPKRLLLRLISVRFYKVLIHQLQVIDPFPLQHHMATLQRCWQVVGQQAPRHGPHLLRHTGPAQLLEVDQVEEGLVEECHKLLRL